MSTPQIAPPQEQAPSRRKSRKRTTAAADVNGAAGRLSFLHPADFDRPRSDEEFLAALDLRSSAPKRLRKAVGAGDVPAAVAALRRQGVGDSAHGGLTDLLPPGDTRPGTARPGELRPRETVLVDLLTSVDRGGKGKKRTAAVEAWLEDADSSPLETWELLGALHLLLQEGRRLEDMTYWRLWRRALEAVFCATTSAEVARARMGQPATSVVAALRASGELPVVAAIVFSAVRGANSLLARGLDVAGEFLEEFTDGDGTPHASILNGLPDLLASLTRTAALAQEADAPWFPAAQKRLRKLAARAAAIGRQTRESASARGPDAAAWLPGASKSEPKSFQSDWAKLVAMHSGEGPQADTVLLAHDGPRVRIVASAAGVPLLRGEWETTLRLEGQPVPLDGEWACCCWFSDRDVDYAELQRTLDNDVKVLRQVALLKRDQALLFAESVTGAGDRAAEIHSRLPLERISSAVADGETREWRIEGDKRPVRLFPLFLPQYLADKAHGAIAADDSSLTWEAMSFCGNVSNAVLLDWNPDRRDAPVDWTRLTVAEDGRAIPATTAVAARLRVGRRQWLVYHSLHNSPLPRTVLGEHTIHESLIGRFPKSGVLQPIVMVEGA